MQREHTMTRHCILAAVLTVVFVTCPARAQVKPAKREETDKAAAERIRKAVAKRMQQRIEELNFEDVELKDVIQFVRDVSGMSIYVKWHALNAAGISRNTTVNIHVKNVTMEKALTLILDDVGAAAPLVWTAEGGVLTISTRDDIDGKEFTRTYAVSHLVRPGRTSLLRRILGGPGCGRRATTQPVARRRGRKRPKRLDEQSAEQHLEALVGLLREMLYDGVLEEECTERFYASHGLLVAKASVFGHQRIAEAIQSLSDRLAALETTLGIAVVRVKDDKERKALAEVLAKAADKEAGLRKGVEDGRWTLDRCRVEETFLGDKIRTQGKGAGILVPQQSWGKSKTHTTAWATYDAVISPEVKQAGRLKLSIACTGTRHDAGSRTNTFRLGISHGGHELIDLTATEGRGGVVLVLWRPKEQPKKK